MSSIRSTSSRMRIWMPPSLDLALLEEVHQAAGRRDDDVGAGAQLAALPAVAHAAVQHRGADVRDTARSRGRPSRPGRRARGWARARGHAGPPSCGCRAARGREARRRRSCRCPVWAEAIRSRPDITAGMARNWIGVGSVYPMACTPRRKLGARLSFVKGIPHLRPEPCPTRG
jgi:hypothetical protein